MRTMTNYSCDELIAVWREEEVRRHGGLAWTQTRRSRGQRGGITCLY
jgi:hypothetical protein